MSNGAGADGQIHLACGISSSAQVEILESQVHTDIYCILSSKLTVENLCVRLACDISSSAQVEILESQVYTDIL